MKKTFLFSIVAAASAAVVVGQVFAGGPAHKASSVSLSVFKQPQTATDRLPAAIRQSHMATHFASLDSRFLGRYGGAAYYAVPGAKDEAGWTICLMGTRGELAWGGCSVASNLKRGLSVDAVENARGDMQVVGLATDGLTRVSYPGGSTRIRDNAFFLTVPRRSMTLRATGPGQAVHTTPLPFGGLQVRHK